MTTCQHEVFTDAASPAPNFACPFAAGEQLAGKYEMLELIGAGGIGFVVSAYHPGFDATVALKFLRPELASNPAVREAFVREARTGFQIKSEHVVRVMDVDTLADGTPFIAMELLYGTDLRRLLDRELRLPLSRVLDYAQQTCAGLEVAHGRGVVHCDIKPENLYLSEIHMRAKWPRGCIKLLDFGIANAGLAPSAPRRRASTLAPVAVGTPRYMSPEQMRGDVALDARTDIWALGCVMYELLSGTPAFDRPTSNQTCAAVLEEEPPPLELLCPQLPAAMIALVSRCLQKDPAQRFPSVAALAAELAAVAQVLTETRKPVASGVRSRSIALPRRRRVKIALALAACAMLAALVWRGVAGHSAPTLQHVVDARPSGAAMTPVSPVPMPEPPDGSDEVRLEHGSVIASHPALPRVPVKHPVRVRAEAPAAIGLSAKSHERPRSAIMSEPDVGF